MRKQNPGMASTCNCVFQFGRAEQGDGGLRRQELAIVSPLGFSVSGSEEKLHTATRRGAGDVIEAGGNLDNVKEEPREFEKHILLPVVDEECSRQQRLQRQQHWLQMAGNVPIPETWGREHLLTDWAKWGIIEDAYCPPGLISARNSLTTDCQARKQ
eukprot:c22901_g1_i1 orf=348-818(-)